MGEGFFKEHKGNLLKEEDKKTLGGKGLPAKRRRVRKECSSFSRRHAKKEREGARGGEGKASHVLNKNITNFKV